MITEENGANLTLADLNVGQCGLVKSDATDDEEQIWCKMQASSGAKILVNLSTNTIYGEGCAFEDDKCRIVDAKVVYSP